LNKYRIDLSCLTFKRNIKRLQKKFPSVKKDLETIFSQLEDEAPLGDPIPLINAPIYKVRLANTDTSKGKRGGYRLIYKFNEENKLITPLLLYFKPEKYDASKKEIEDALDSVEKGLFDEV